jgi:hypothetical protein
VIPKARGVIAEAFGVPVIVTLDVREGLVHRGALHPIATAGRPLS